MIEGAVKRPRGSLSCNITILGWGTGLEDATLHRSQTAVHLLHAVCMRILLQNGAIFCNFVQNCMHATRTGIVA
jgi:hypothetical protein